MGERAAHSVAEMRKTISSLEQQVSEKQREAQKHRTLASADLGTQRSTINAELEQLEHKMTRLRERAQEMTVEDKGTDAYEQLRTKGARLKERKKQLRLDLQNIDVDPAAAQEVALRMETEANELHRELSSLRTNELVELEREHMAQREACQAETAQFSEVRSRHDQLERQCNELKETLDRQWKACQPIWASRLKHWGERTDALSGAQAHAVQLNMAVERTWELFNEEQVARRDVLLAVAAAQASLAEVAQQVSAFGDLD
eukprot:NODE_13336_length_1171_cov_7.695402.p1 GENE.NODE_13336_length_1171_cov_7.695402~~NODE_13336_length_1171_cov_7.695402.p1  ORF type:complete len:260 (-),score=84.53 NODE_13336_length_1171_cov_7.695402:391-1170(-)